MAARDRLDRDADLPTREQLRAAAEIAGAMPLSWLAWGFTCAAIVGAGWVAALPLRAGYTLYRHATGQPPVATCRHCGASFVSPPACDTCACRHVDPEVMATVEHEIREPKR